MQAQGIRITDRKTNPTPEAFGQALNWVNQNTSEKIVNALKLQSLCYHEIRAHFGLSSNLAQQVCRRVAGPPKVAKQKHCPVKAVKAGFVTYIDWAVGNTAWRLLVILGVERGSRRATEGLLENPRRAA
ncbi:MAG: hypothetical protein Q6L60_14235 [Thermostichus sp. HHBFW_bins_43]